MLASHNSGTGYKLAWPWYAHGPINWWARCQTMTLEEQWALETRFFDFRVRTGHSTSDIIVCHGIAEYDLTLQNALETINSLSSESGDKVYVLIRHDRTCNQNDLDDVVQAYQSYKETYSSLLYIGLTDAQEGYTIVEGDVSRPSTREMHGSVDSGWKKYWPPYLWSLFYNKDEYSEYADYVLGSKKYLMLDFLEVN